MKKIPLTQGKEALIDDEDFAIISQYKWRAQKSRNTFYALTNIGPWREKKVISMHRFLVAGVSSGSLVDHEDRNGLNNQKRNLRIVDRFQNGANRTAYGSSKYLGVNKKGVRACWMAYIGINGKRKYIGTFRSEEEAARAYNNAAIIYHGKFANLNHIL